MDYYFDEYKYFKKQPPCFIGICPSLYANEAPEVSQPSCPCSGLACYHLQSRNGLCQPLISVSQKPLKLGDSKQKDVFLIIP